MSLPSASDIGDGINATIFWKRQSMQGCPEALRDSCGLCIPKENVQCGHYWIKESGTGIFPSVLRAMLGAWTTTWISSLGWEDFWQSSRSFLESSEFQKHAKLEKWYCLSRMVG